MRESFSELSLTELNNKREELMKKHREIRFNVVVGHVENAMEERLVRRKIARLNTLIHEFDLGMRKQ